MNNEGRANIPGMRAQVPPDSIRNLQLENDIRDLGTENEFLKNRVEQLEEENRVLSYHRHFDEDLELLKMLYKEFEIEELNSDFGPQRADYYLSKMKTRLHKIRAFDPAKQAEPIDDSKEFG